MILITSDNEFSLGIAKMILGENKISYEYDYSGYRISEEEFEKVSNRLKKIRNLEIRRA